MITVLAFFLDQNVSLAQGGLCPLPDFGIKYYILPLYEEIFKIFLSTLSYFAFLSLHQALVDIYIADKSSLFRLTLLVFFLETFQLDSECRILRSIEY